jgi:thioredoxin 1
MANTLALTDAQFKAEVLDAKVPVLVDFWATWCAPCIAMEPTLEELATAHLGKLKVVKVNIEENQVTAQAFGVRSLPNFLLFNGGKVVTQIAGAVSKQKLGEAVQKVL